MIYVNNNSCIVAFFLIMTTYQLHNMPLGSTEHLQIVMKQQPWDLEEFIRRYRRLRPNIHNLHIRIEQMYQQNIE